MEKPSLEIGNGNWAIKENSLLGYTTVDGMILPDPITVTRASLATRVNPSGLIEDVEFLGSEEIVNGSFTGVANGTDVTTLANWNNYNSPTSRNVVDNKLVIVATGGNQGAYYTPGALTGLHKLSVDVSGDVGAGAIYISDPATVISTSVGTVEHYFVGTGSSGTGIFFRAGSNSAGTTSYTNISVKKATINGLAKIDYTDGTASLLVEPARTNTVTYSEDFSQYSHGGVAPTLTTGQLAPDGTLTATKVSGIIGNTSLYKTSVTSTTATRSIYARTVSGTGTASLMSYHSNTNNTFTITEEWQRFELTGAVATGGANFYAIDFRDSSTTLSEVIIWGAQAEEAAYPTSYIKTQGSTVTRAQDVITKTGISDKINSTEGVFFVETAFLNDTGNYKSVTLSDGTTANRITLENRPVANQIKVFIVVSGTNVMQSTQTLTDVKAFNKMAIKWKQNDFAWFVNGVKIHTDTSGNTFSANTLNRLGFDRGDGFTLLESKVKQLQVYKTALTDLEIESLTSFASFTEMANTLNYTIY